VTLRAGQSTNQCARAWRAGSYGDVPCRGLPRLDNLDLSPFFVGNGVRSGYGQLPYSQQPAVGGGVFSAALKGRWQIAARRKVTQDRDRIGDIEQPVVVASAASGQLARGAAEEGLRREIASAMFRALRLFACAAQESSFSSCSSLIERYVVKWLCHREAPRYGPANRQGACQDSRPSLENHTVLENS